MGKYDRPHKSENQRLKAEEPEVPVRLPGAGYRPNHDISEYDPGEPSEMEREFASWHDDAY